MRNSVEPAKRKMKKSVSSPNMHKLDTEFTNVTKLKQFRMSVTPSEKTLFHGVSFEHNGYLLSSYTYV